MEGWKRVSRGSRRSPRRSSSDGDGSPGRGILAGTGPSAVGLVLLVAVLAVAGSAAAAVSLDATSTKTGASDLTTLTVNHTTPSGQDRLLAVTMAWDDLNDASLSNVDYAGDPMTCHDLARGTGVATVVCTLAGPATGDHELNITWDVTVTEHAIVMSSYTGVHQTTPVGANATAAGSGTEANLTIDTRRADATIVGGTIAETTGVSLTPRTGVTEDADLTAGASSLGISHAAGRKDAPTSGSYDFGWNLSSSEAWATAAVEVHRADHEVAFDTDASSGDESATSPSLGVSINESSNVSISVDYAVVGGNASGGGDDYTLSDGTLTVDAGTTSGSVDVSVGDDDSDEPDETIDVQLSNPSTGAVVTNPSLHNYTIVDDDPNHAPTASDDSISTDEDTDVSDTLPSSDQDQGDTIDSYAINTSPSHGTVSLDASTGKYTYSPDADYNGDDSFTFNATDNHGATSGNATVNVTVKAVNDAPTASDDSAPTDENETIWIDVIANDEDVDDDSLSVASVTSPSHGTTTIPGNGTVEYSPDPGYTGTDAFDYDATDGNLSDTASVSVTVKAASVEVVSTNVRDLSGDLTGDPTVNTTAFSSSLNVQLENASGGIDLASMGATNDSLLEVNLTIKNFTPTVLMGRAQVVDWTNTTNADGSENVSFTLEPISMAFVHDCKNYTAFMGYCGPNSPDDWPTDDSDDQADVAFDAALRVFVSDLSYLNETMQDALQGGYMTTDAQAIGAMNVTPSDSPGGATLSIPVAGPHKLPNGTNNTGFFEARIPDPLVDWWGIDDPSALTGEYQGEDIRVTISDVDKGTEFRMDIHYSSGDANITEDTTDPTADAGADQTVEEGDTVTFDGSGSSDNQEVTNWNWTFDDGSTGAGEFTNHTYSSAGDYVVTLNVSDGAGNTDTDTVNVTVESGSSGGGGGGSSDDAEADTRVTAANLSAADVEPGETVAVTADVTNAGDADGWHNVTFEAGDASVGHDRVHVSVDETVTAEATVSLDEAGTYEVTADGVTAGTLTVAHPAPAAEAVVLAGSEPAPDRTVEVQLWNPGAADQTVHLGLVRDGTTVADLVAGLPANATMNVTFDGAVTEAGTYEVQVESTPAGTVSVETADLSSSDVTESRSEERAGGARSDDEASTGEPLTGAASGTREDGSTYHPPAAIPAPGVLAALASGLAAAWGRRARRR